MTIGNDRVGTLSLSGNNWRYGTISASSAFCGVQAVLGLVPDGRVRPVEDLLGDLLAVVRRQAVEHDRVGAGEREQLVVDLEAGEVPRRCSRSSSWPMLVQTSV